MNKVTINFGPGTAAWKDMQEVACKCQDKHVHFRLFKHVQNQSFSLLK
ncbi:hypothetical protein [Bacillus cereus group sp. BfR-BA-01393]|nr:hypothetical protein [Bacillus cereus group sp. BfR-BA-01393]